MNLLLTFRVALRALARNKMRSVLTMLGIIIGVGAVICSVAVGEGASNQVQEQIRSIGDNMIWIEAGGRNVNGLRTGARGTKSLTLGDAKVIGELATKGQSAFGQDQDDVLIMPFTTVQRKIKGIDWLDDIMCSAASGEAIAPSERQITALLRERHHLRPDEEDDFNLRHPADLAQASAQSERVMTLLLASIASISLVVGGIGIMNIMLVSVTERTREIGLRMALGATEESVQMQFLSEATVLSLLGGSLGVMAGAAGSLVISNTLRWPTQIPPQASL